MHCHVVDSMFDIHGFHTCLICDFFSRHLFAIDFFTFFNDSLTLLKIQFTLCLLMSSDYTLFTVILTNKYITSKLYK